MPTEDVIPKGFVTVLRKLNYCLSNLINLTPKKFNSLRTVTNPFEITFFLLTSEGSVLVKTLQREIKQVLHLGNKISLYTSLAAATIRCVDKRVLILFTNVL